MAHTTMQIAMMAVVMTWVAVAPPVSQRSGGEQILERWGIRETD